MKNHLMTRLLAVLLCAVMLFLVACGPDGSQTSESASESAGESTTPENGDEAIATEERMLYVNAEIAQPFPVSFYEDVPDILLIEMETANMEFFAGLLSHYGDFIVEETETTITITRSNGTYCVLDFVQDTVYFDDYDLFFTKNFQSNFGDHLGFSYLDEAGNSFYIQRELTLYTPGSPILLDLASREIPMDIYEGKKYLPFQTFNDLFLSPFSLDIANNSQDLFMAQGGAISQDLLDLYYSIEPGNRSQELANFTYSELCLLLDISYGLQEEHKILNGFSDFFAVTEMTETMLDPDASKFGGAMLTLTLGYFADLHSGMKMASPYTGDPQPVRPEDLNIAPSVLRYSEMAQLYEAKRAEWMPDGVPGYQEMGNTAYVTFDTFSFDTDRVAGYNETSTAITDTFGLIIYAHSMITREDSPIENVVVDLSCNGGGAYDAAVYVVSWMLGYCDVHVTNPITNATATTSYMADVNLDGVFDENDTISHLNLFCITSPVSFSCGNLVPALLKESGLVTLLGGTSGGGSCLVKHFCTADGALLQLSSPWRLSTVSNGSYYNIDTGVEPHFRLITFASYYNREALTEYINNLY